MVKWKPSSLTKDNECFGYSAYSVRDIPKEKWWGMSIMQICSPKPSHKWKALIFCASKTGGLMIHPQWPNIGEKFNDLNKAKESCEKFLTKHGFDLTKQNKTNEIKTESEVKVNEKTSNDKKSSSKKGSSPKVKKTK